MSNIQGLYDRRDRWLRESKHPETGVDRERFLEHEVEQRGVTSFGTQVSVSFEHVVTACWGTESKAMIQCGRGETYELALEDALNRAGVDALGVQP